MPTIKKLHKRTSRNDSYYDVERRKIYNSRRWQHLRRLKFINNPLCELCAEKGLITPAEDIHHVISFMSTEDPVRRRWLAYDYDNLMSLCKKCHQNIHNGNTLKR